jgi:filamentous hemagglutinin family protein
MQIKLAKYRWFEFKQSTALTLILNGALALFLTEPFAFGNRATAQIKPDGTLGAESSVVTPNAGGVDLLSGGATRGTNLFHSFEQFSVLTGRTAFFNNALDVQNIISRVTGKSVSNIDGLIRANGTANLFLLNPNGIIFGPNASLNIGGSILASTASSLNFADGTQLSIRTPQSVPLLTVSVPIGLQFGQNPGAIHVQGTGHSLTIPISHWSPILGAGGSSNGLRMPPGKTLALVGGNVELEGGILTAPGGRIELGGVGSGVVNLNPTSTGWTLSYGSVQNFQDVALSQQALVDVSGFRGGSIQLMGRQISLVDGAVGLTQNQGTQSGGSINVSAFTSLELTGTTPDGNIPSGFQNETLGGNAGDITVLTKRLVLEDGAAINTKTFTEANASDIILTASDSTQIIGFSPVNPTVNIASGIGAYTLSSGKSGEIVINTGQFTGLNGGTVISATFGTGKGGDLTVNAERGIQLTGFNPFVSIAPSQLAVGTFNTGDTGNLTINTPKLFLQNGGNINSYTFSAGNAGSIKINAFDSVNITRAGTNGLPYDQRFGISSYAAVTSDTIQQLLRIPPGLSGASGDITINTERLTATDGSLVNVGNLGTGTAGSLRINANIVSVDNNAAIGAATASGEGGNIFLEANILQLRHNSTINATASDPQLVSSALINPATAGTGNGGNITIETDILVALENSSITANAFEGRGGNISINTQGIFRSPDSDITATSQLGINGTVQINTPDTDPSRALVTLPTQPVEATGLIAQGCPGSGGNVGRETSDFIITGRGGLPPYQPGEPLRAEGLIVKERELEAGQEKRSFEVTAPPSTPDELVEATGWVFNDKGEVVLTAYPTNATPYSSLSASTTTCYAP